MITINLRCLADYMTANPSRQRTILRDYKYDDSQEAQAKIKYYRDARDAVSGFHRNGHSGDWLLGKAKSLEAQAVLESGRRRTKLRHNARALRSYEKFFGDKNYEILALPKWSLTSVGVRVLVRPDLYVREKGKEKTIKLEFAVKEPTAQFARIISQCMFEAARDSGLVLPSSSVLFLDVDRGKVHKGARLGARMKKDIEASCMAIAAIWDGI